MENVDKDFYKRADAHIQVSNDQMTPEIDRGKVAASNMYAVARFNAWVSASGWDSAEAMANAKQETLEYFVAEFSKMLEENLDDYIENFEAYLAEPE